MASPFSLRLSDELRKLLKLAAKEADVTLASLIVRACWQYLESSAGRPAQALPSMERDHEKRVPESKLPTLEDRKAIAMQAMQAMSDALMKDAKEFRTSIQEPDPSFPDCPAEVIPANRCHNKDQNASGDWFRCIKEKGHKGNHLPSAFAEEY